MLPSLPRQPGKNQHDTAATLRRISNYTELHFTPLQHISQHSATGAHGGRVTRAPRAYNARRYRSGSWSNISLQWRQQKYTARPENSERNFAVAPSTIIPQIGSFESIRTVGTAGSVSATPALSLRRCWMISARMLTAISSGVTAPMSSPAGALSR